MTDDEKRSFEIIAKLMTGTSLSDSGHYVEYIVYPDLGGPEIVMEWVEDAVKEG